MRTALFNYEDHRESVKAAIESCDPQALMIIGTSDRMTDIVATQLGLPLPEERIYIEDVTTEEQRELAAAIRSFVDELSSQERQVFLARYWYLASVEEIARRMNYSQSKVKSMLYRLRGRLRERLTEEGLC